jgi:two-component system NtrC family sensor kinase
MEWHTLLDQIFESLTEGVTIEDASGHLIFASRALEHMLEYEPEEVTGLHWTFLLPEELRDQEEAQHAREADCFTSRYETRLQRKDGDSFPVLVHARPLFEGNRRRWLLSTFTDLRRRSHVRNPFQQAERMALMGQHVASVAHELSNPLTIILLEARLLSRVDPTSAHFQNGLATIQKQVRRIDRMAGELLAFSDPHMPELTATDVNAVVEQALEPVIDQLQTDGIEVTAELVANLPVTQADPYQLEQVFVNLINNAHQALSDVERKGKLRISSALTSGKDGPESRIHVRFMDNGPGIPPDVMPHIFEPFFTTKTPGQGTGLGLTVCDRIVRAHGGRIWAESHAQGGATFVVELPVAEASQQAQATRASGSVTPSEAPLAYAAGDRYSTMNVEEKLRMAQTVRRLSKEAGIGAMIRHLGAPNARPSGS